jgi:hypothetical protein
MMGIGLVAIAMIAMMGVVAAVDNTACTPPYVNTEQDIKWLEDYQKLITSSLWTRYMMALDSGNQGEMKSISELLYTNIAIRTQKPPNYNLYAMRAFLSAMPNESRQQHMDVRLVRAYYMMAMGFYDRYKDSIAPCDTTTSITYT